MLDLAALQQELKYFRQEVMTLQVMALRPGQSAAELRWLRQREREARAKVKRHVRAIEDYDHRLKSRYRPASAASAQGQSSKPSGSTSCFGRADDREAQRSSEHVVEPKFSVRSDLDLEKECHRGITGLQDLGD
jgi:hypothetical protein